MGQLFQEKKKKFVEEVANGRVFIFGRYDKIMKDNKILAHPNSYGLWESYLHSENAFSKSFVLEMHFWKLFLVGLRNAFPK